MKKINLQDKTTAKLGKIEMYYFENENIGLEKTLFHRIYIPLTPFDSGLDYESQPVETEILIEWLDLELKNPTNLDGLMLTSNSKDDTEISIYVGSTHNPCDIKSMVLRKTGEDQFEINCNLLVDFEYEEVAPREVFNFKTTLILERKIKE
ncbi:MAG: hypothetical protein AAGJ18_03680 [Bacteroidota bacterium]